MWWCECCRSLVHVVKLALVVMYADMCTAYGSIVVATQRAVAVAGNTEAACSVHIHCNIAFKPQAYWQSHLQP
jgi:hypothetical protein